MSFVPQRTEPEIWGLQKKGYKIEASEERDEFGFVSYKLTE